MKLNRDQITGMALVVLGVIVAALVSQFRVPLTLSYPGPKMLPMIAVTGFIICGIGIFLSGMKNKENQKVFLVKEGWIRLMSSLGLLAIYILGMKFLGYLMVTPFACYGITTLYAKGSQSTRKNRIVYSIGLTVILYVTYVYAFGLGLPAGELFG